MGDQVDIKDAQFHVLESNFRVRLKRDRARRRLSRILSRAPDEAFLRMIWAADALEGGEDRAADGWRWFSDKAPELVGKLKGRERFFHKWLLETLANQLLLVPKAKVRRDRQHKTLNCRSLTSIVEAVNLLHDLEDAEDAEDGKTLRRVSVFTQMHRLGQRQFPWQRGKVSKRVFYKSSFLYAFPEAKKRFEERHGISVDDFSLVAFALYALLQSHSGCRLPFDLSSMGVSRSVSDKAISILSTTVPQARMLAKSHRANSTHTAYTASVFRQSPIIRFSDVLVAPIPDLIIERITDGLYYDVVISGDGATNMGVTSRIGKRFERYCHDLLCHYLANISAKPEFRYGDQHSPDLILECENEMIAVVECKAKKEPVGAKFGEEKIALQSAGIDELANGVFQIWRFFSHIRRGIVKTAPTVTQSTIGILLTLDTWFEASGGHRDEVLKRAHILANRKGDEISKDDRRPIVFCNIDDLEFLMARAEEQDFLRVLSLASEPERQGWLLDGIYRELPDAHPIEKTDPFADRLSAVATWLAHFE